MKITVGILTVSDACSRGEREDGSGAALKRAVEASGWEIAARAVVADEPGTIQAALLDWVDAKGVRLVLTTGGTGIGPRDTTPEATRPVLHKELPGFGELMRQEGLKHTSRAVLSRAVAGVRGRSLIVNLPGSPAGAEESLAALAGLIPHALEVLEGAGHEPSPAEGAIASGSGHTP